MNTLTSIHRGSPLRLRNGSLLRNRLVIPPMASQRADPRGFVTESMLNHYRRLAMAQPGLLIVEYTFVHPSGQSEDHQLGIQSDQHIDGLRQLVQVIQSTGAMAGLQLNHAGGKSERRFTGGALMAPSPVAVPVKDRELEIPQAMGAAEIALWKEAFLRAVDRAVMAGFDLVELHAAHGYGLNQWLSPITNHRTDEYGGSLEARSRLLLDIVHQVRTNDPHLGISVRMPGQDFLPGGMKVHESIRLAQMLEAAQVDVLHISSGIGGWRRPVDRVGEGYLVAEAEQIQSAVGIPVIGVGGIETGNYIDQALEKGSFSLAAVGRAILRDPSVWSRQNIACAPRRIIHG